MAAIFLLAACQGEDTYAPKSPTITSSTPIYPLKIRNPTPTDNQTKNYEAQASATVLPPTPISSTAIPTRSQPTRIPSFTPTPDFPKYAGPPLEKGNLGVQVHIHHEDLGTLMEHLQNLGVGWVKVQVSWKLYQPAPDRYDEERFTELDGLVSAAQDKGIKVLLSVSKAPEWSRPVTEMDGPPLNYQLYRNFLRVLGSRYLGRVAAYELWNEPNLQREWNGTELNAADFVRLVNEGASGLRETDPQAILISGAPAVTGINDGVVAIDDRVFLRSMLKAGIAGQIDAVGVHPYGWANPPESSFGSPDPAAASHNDHPSFFFINTLQDYANLLHEFGVQKQLWTTEFGWGSFQGINNKLGTPEPPPENALFMNDVSEKEQARYILQAFAMGQDLDTVGPMFLWNLNFGPLLGTQFSESGYSLLRPDGSKRPSYLALQNAAKK